MARGESHKARTESSAISLWAVLGVLTLVVGLLIVSMVGDCSIFGGPPPTPPEAYPGASEAFEGLGDRDCRVWDVALGARPDDLLRARGYVPAGDPATTELPFDEPAGPLEGECGLVVVLAAPNTMLLYLESDQLRNVPCGGRIASVAVCGASRVRATGTGQVEISRWTFPGLTPADVEGTGLTPEQALGLAEGEQMLRRRGYRATTRALRAELGASDTSWALPAPPSGCVPWVVAAVGFDDLWTTTDRVSEVHRDSHAGRQLAGAVSCADGGGRVHFEDAQRNGGVIVALPFALHGGPHLPDERADLGTLPGVRVVGLDELELPEPVPTGP